MKDKIIVITGASSGIGKAIALECSGRGACVVLAARNFPALKEVERTITIKGGHCLVVSTDVASEESCKLLIDKTLERFGRIDVLINNAGISMRAIFGEMSLDVFRRVMDINFWGCIYCTHFAMPHLLKSKGSVVGISSIAGVIGLPARTGYSASKYGLQGFLDALRNENRKTGLHVLTVLPGYTESAIRKNALNADGEKQEESPMAESKIMSASYVAVKTAQAIVAKKKRIVLSTEGKLAYFISRLWPSFADFFVFRKVSSEKGSPIRME